MKSYYPGTLPKITGDPKEMFRVLDGKVCEFERSKELRTECIKKQIEAADAIMYESHGGVRQLVSPSFEKGHEYRITVYDADWQPNCHHDVKTAREAAECIWNHAEPVEAVIL